MSGDASAKTAEQRGELRGKIKGGGSICLVGTQQRFHNLGPRETDFLARATRGWKSGFNWEAEIRARKSLSSLKRKFDQEGNVHQ